MLVDVLVLNHNGRDLLARCLPSVLRAAQTSRHDCRVAVIDNSSVDDSREWLAKEYPTVPVICCENRGLCSFNRVLATSTSPVAVLLNNDILLDAACLDPLVRPFQQQADERSPRCFLTAPLCWRFDGTTYEGQKTAVRWRAGLVQATSRFPGHEGGIHVAGPTASAGAAIAVDRRVFLELGGFDPLYLPGILEDLDLAYRGFLAGFQAMHVPEAVAWHLGRATFGKAFGEEGCNRLALRNTLLFQWKNLRHPRHLLRQCVGLSMRVIRDLTTAPLVPRQERFALVRALREAWQCWRRHGNLRCSLRGNWRREAEFFSRFHPRRMAQQDATLRPSPEMLTGLTLARLTRL